MLSKLKEIYQDKCVIDEMPPYPNDFFWFKTADHHLVGISKTINSGEKRLLSLMFDEVVAVDFDYRTRLLWMDILSGNVDALSQIEEKHLKFIFFNYHFESGAKDDFESLIKEFNAQYLTLFMNKSFGVILVFHDTDEEELETFVEAARLDFDYGLTFYQTTAFPIDETLYLNYQSHLEWFRALYHPGKLVMKKQDLLLESLSLNVRKGEVFEGFRSKVKACSAENREVVMAYFEHNFNLSLAAKEQHMHRNTFMNKLDKFIEQTDLNVKEFGQATLAYLLIKSLIKGGEKR